MRLGPRLDRTAFTDRIDEIHAKIRRSAGLLPLYGLADWPGPRFAGDWGWSDGVLSRAGLGHGLPTEAGPWVQVVTTAGPPDGWLTGQRATGALADKPMPDAVTRLRMYDEVVAIPAGEVSIEVAGVPRRWRHWPQRSAGGLDTPDWYAALDEVPGLAVLARGCSPADLHLVVVTEVEPYLAGRRDYLLAQYDAANPT